MFTKGIHLWFFKKPSIITTAFAFALLQGCSPLSYDQNSSDKISGIPKSEQLILGKKLQDPYTVESVKAALLSLVNQKNRGLAKMSVTTIDSIDIEPNYLYVRFLPEGRLQEGRLQNHDTNLVMFPYPMDQEIIQVGRDPSLPDSVKAYYAAVPVGYSFCDTVKYEILKELFLIEPVLDSIDSIKTLAKKASAPVDPFISLINAYGISFLELDMASLKLTGNLDARIKDVDTTGLAQSKKLSKTGWFSSGYRPTGTITYQDDILGKVPVVGARVTSGYWYSWTSSTTNANGYFSSGSTYTWGVDYHLHFDASDFVFQKNGMVEGPTGTKSAWNINLTGKWGAVAACFAGAYNYYYTDIEGLCRPHQNKWYNVKLDLEVFDEDGGDANGMFVVVPVWLAQSIKIWLKTGDSYKSTPSLYGTTCHELAHNAHFQNFQTRNWALPRDVEFVLNVSDHVKETFARGIQWRFSTRRYPNAFPTWSYFHYNKGGYDALYSGLVEDLVDNVTTYAQESTSNVDLVQGFSMKQIENAVMESWWWAELKDKLKAKYPSGSTTGLIYTITDYDNLFNWWYYDCRLVN